MKFLVQSLSKLEMILHSQGYQDDEPSSEEGGQVAQQDEPEPSPLSPPDDGLCLTRGVPSVFTV